MLVYIDMVSLRFDKVICKIYRPYLWLLHALAQVKKNYSVDFIQISHDRVLGMSVNVPTKASFPPPKCFLFVCGESYFYTLGHIYTVGFGKE